MYVHDKNSRPHLEWALGTASCWKGVRKRGDEEKITENIAFYPILWSFAACFLIKK